MKEHVHIHTAMFERGLHLATVRECLYIADPSPHLADDTPGLICIAPCSSTIAFLQMSAAEPGICAQERHKENSSNSKKKRNPSNSKKQNSSNSKKKNFCNSKKKLQQENNSNNRKKNSSARQKLCNSKKPPNYPQPPAYAQAGNFEFQRNSIGSAVGKMP